MIIARARTCAAIVALLCSSAAVAQIPGVLTSDPHADAKAQVLGVLTHTPLTLRFEDVPARDAFKAIGRALGLNVIGRYSDDAVGHGIDPEICVTMIVENRSARDVIEELLEQCEVYEDCTWQLRLGFVEIGTKRRLAAKPAWESRIYDVTDLSLEPAYFGTRGRYQSLDTPYVESLLGQESRDSVREGRPPQKDKVDCLLELAEGMVETIEPGHWDLGGSRTRPAPREDQDDAAESQQSPPLLPKVADRSAGADLQQKDEDIWASMRLWREGLIIKAPDFIHRQISGYPKPAQLGKLTAVVVPAPVAAPPSDEPD